MATSEKVALITGGARIGQTVALALAQRGHHVIITYRSSVESARETLRRITALGARATAIRADIRRTADTAKLFRTLHRRFGRLDVLVNMVSLYEKTPLASLLNPNTAKAALQKQMGTDLESAYSLSLLSAPLMQKNGYGRIVHFSDWVAASARPRYHDYIPYYTAKAAVKGLTEALALELAPTILVNSIAPGPILPPSDLSASEQRAVVKHTPLGRWGGAEEIAKAVLFFVDSNFVTGECLRVDGGRHLT
jgi:NAD(P)-dependent dehydrogenase (short-subunit alcohol dehydrogenase family)